MDSELRIGTAGWAIPAACRELAAAEGTHLERYSRLLNCAEINSSFYRPHRKSTYARWADSVPASFAFSVKVPKAITHTKRCVDCGAEFARFLDETAGLGEKRRVLLVQLPPSFAYEERMEGFFRDVRAAYDGLLVCEPRHLSWFTPDVDATLSRFRIGRVAADPARCEAAARPGGWDGIAYYRQHGSPRMYYSRYEPPAVEALAAALAENRAPERWCIFDNTGAGAAFENAKFLLRLLFNSSTVLE